MYLRSLALLLALAALAAFGAQNSPGIKPVPVTQTSAVSGQQMFDTYCAVCHGKDGRGNGPASAALKKAPSDLTQIARRHNGSFPEIDVQQVISGQFTVTAHGTRDMPVWGDLFRSLDGGSASIGQLRVDNLTNYLKTLQRK